MARAARVAAPGQAAAHNGGEEARAGGKRTPERALAIANALKAGATRRAAAGHAGIDQNTFYRWLASDPAFKVAVDEAEAASELFFTTKVYQAASKGDSWQAAAWWLERRRSAEYGRRDRLDVNMDVKTAAARIAIAEELDVGELLAEAERIVAAGAQHDPPQGAGEADR